MFPPERRRCPAGHLPACTPGRERKAGEAHQRQRNLSRMPMPGTPEAGTCPCRIPAAEILLTAARPTRRIQGNAPSYGPDDPWIPVQPAVLRQSYPGIPAPEIPLRSFPRGNCPPWKCQRPWKKTRRSPPSRGTQRKRRSVFSNHRRPDRCQQFIIGLICRKIRIVRLDLFRTAEQEASFAGEDHIQIIVAVAAGNGVIADVLMVLLRAVLKLFPIIMIFVVFLLFLIFIRFLIPV